MLRYNYIKDFILYIILMCVFLALIIIYKGGKTKCVNTMFGWT